MNRPLAALAALGALLVALTAAARALPAAGAITLGSARSADRFTLLAMAAVAVWLVAVRLVLRCRTDRAATVAVLAVGVALRAMLLPGPPLLSSDIYRYAWDGQVQRAGINPYRYVPADPALAPLRDPAVYPHINRAAVAHTIYPPAAELVFGLTARLAPRGGIGAVKLAMAACELVAVLCLLRLLSLAGLPSARILIYLWNPLVLWSFACDGHVDAIAAALLACALLARATLRDGTAGALLAGAALVKFLPLAAAPALLRGARERRFILAGVATVIVLYGFYAGVGTRVLGFLPGYGREEGLSTGGGFWLVAGLAKLGPSPRAILPFYAVAVACVLAIAALATWRRRIAPAERIPVLCRDTAILAALAMAAVSPHYFWYYAWLAVPCTVAPIPAVLWLSSAAMLLLLDPVQDRFTWESLVWIPAALLAWRSVRTA